MSNFLWVEDFENHPKATASNVFGGVLDESLFNEDERILKKNLKTQGIFIELTLQDGLDFIAPDVEKKIDFIILDIDLPAHGDDGLNDEVLGLLQTFENYQKLEDEAEDETSLKTACNKMKEIAGFYIYTKLVVELGFPKQHILFCSNHADNTKKILKAFKTARIALPKIYEKADPYVKTWVEDHYQNPYSRLRRGIIEACIFLQDKNLRFNKFGTDDKKLVELDLENYLEILKAFLPLREPADTMSMYKLFIRTLAHEWDDAVRPKKLNNQRETLAFSWIMKITRNWSAHTHVFDHLKAQDVAFLFIINMRAMFDLGENLTPYEKHFLRLFETPLEVNKFKSIVGNDFKDRQIPLTQSYAWLLKEYGTNYKAIAFHDLLNEFQKKKSGNEDVLVKGLYQAFWFLTSYGHVYIVRDNIQDQKVLKYQFAYFDYGSKEYLLEIGRHIYNSSFPELKP